MTPLLHGKAHQPALHTGASSLLIHVLSYPPTPTFLANYPSIHLTIHSSCTHPATHSSVYLPSIYPHIQPFIHSTCIHPSTQPPIYLCIIHPSIPPSLVHPPIYSLIQSSIRIVENRKTKEMYTGQGGRGIWILQHGEDLRNWMGNQTGCPH